MAAQRPFTMEEVEDVIKCFRGDKAPGFNLMFFQKCWSTVKDDVWRIVERFHKMGTFIRSLNSTFVALIPTKKGAIEVKDFRPINLLGSVYKILAKLLAERLKLVIDNLVSESQNAFIKGRQITDASTLANESIEYLLKRKKIGVAYKLDLEKAYDHVDWSCLLSIMNQMNFGDKWIEWISYCISTVRFSVLINGNPQGYFRSQRGLRQGDPLSPYLFTLVMEAFSKILMKAEELGWVKGMSFGSTNEDRV